MKKLIIAMLLTTVVGCNSASKPGTGSKENCVEFAYSDRVSYFNCVKADFGHKLAQILETRRVEYVIADDTWYYGKTSGYFVVFGSQDRR